MDNLQTSLKNASSQIIPALNDRQRLKALLSDCLVDNRLPLNLLLNAFDIAIVEKLQNSPTGSSKELFLQRLVHNLTGDYGITEQSALWAIDTWCIILGVTPLSSNTKVNSFIPSTANGSTATQVTITLPTTTRMKRSAIQEVPQSVIYKLLEGDDYIDFKLSQRGIYYPESVK